MIISCVGDVGLDRYPNQNKEFAGGTSLNVAFQLSKLSGGIHSVHLLSAIGRDSDALLIQTRIRESLIIENIQSLLGSTASQIITIKDNGEKYFERFDAGVLLEWKLNEVQMKIILESDYIVCPYFKQIEHVVEVVLLLKNKKGVVVDFNDLSDYSIKDSVLKFIKSFEIGFFGLQEGDKRINELQEISEKYEKLFIVTLGNKGAVVFENGKATRSVAKSVENVVDTTGAGDSFLASFLFSYIKGDSIIQSLGFASGKASRVVQRLGA